MAQTPSSKTSPKTDLPAEMIDAAHETDRPTFEPEPRGLYQGLAWVVVIGIFLVILTCICSCTGIIVAFLMNPPW
jgi:hypothetical protein